VDRAGNAQTNRTAAAKHLCRPAVTPNPLASPVFQKPLCLAAVQ